MLGIWIFIPGAACALLLASHQAHAASKTTSAMPFLNLGVDARGIAMGGAASAIAEDASALFWNPAALTQMPRHGLTFMHAAQVESMSANFAAYGHNGGRGAFAAAFYHHSAGNIDRVDETGADLGSFTPQDSAATLGYGYRWDRLSMGLSVKHMRSKITQSARATAGDAGLLYRAGQREKLHLALVASNLGEKLKGGSVSETLPVILKIGGAFFMKERWILSLEGGLPKLGNAFAATGLERLLVRSPAWSMALRFGANSDQLSQGPKASGFFGGIGIELGSLRFDYAAGFYGELGLQQSASLSFRFGQSEWAPKPIKASKPKPQQAPTPQAPSTPMELPKIDIPQKTYIPYQPDRGVLSEKKQRVYIIRDGDTYLIIAKRLYGKEWLWKKLQQANRHLSNGALKPGQKILVPPLE